MTVFWPAVLSKSFRESRVTADLKGGFPDNHKPYTDDYEYFCDSDLEEEIEDEESSDAEAAPSTSEDASSAPAKGNSAPKHLDEEEVCHDDHCSVYLQHTDSRYEAQPNHLSEAKGAGNAATSNGQEDTSSTGKVVVLPSFAHAT